MDVRGFDLYKGKVHDGLVVFGEGLLMMRERGCKSGALKALGLALCALTLWAGPGYAQSFPNKINFQGRITDSAGSLINTPQNLTFKIYGAATGGSAVWTETQTGVTVSSGLFAAALGAVNPLPPTVFASSGTYLEITVGSNVLSPRKLLTMASPYADSAGSLQGRAVTDFAYYTAGNVGLGSTAPPVLLTVNRGAAGLTTIIENSGSSDEVLRLQNNSKILSLQSNSIASNNPLNIGNGQNTILRTDIGSGKVGVGNLSPAATLDISGIMKAPAYVISGAAPQGVMYCRTIAYTGSDKTCPADGVLVSWDGAVGSPGNGSTQSVAYPASGNKRCCFK